MLHSLAMDVPSAVEGMGSMRALAVKPGTANAIRLLDLPASSPAPGEMLVRTTAVGICGTDREIVAGEYGEAPPGEEYLILGHESVGRVEQSPAGCELCAGDLVVAMVRRPDPVPCPNCAAGEWDICRNGGYTEHGIKGRHGFCADCFSIEPHRVVKLDRSLGVAGVLVEPASVVAKAWEHIDRIGARAVWEPRRVLITGAGPIGLLAALLGTLRQLEVHVLDRVTRGPKPDLVKDLGAIYHVGDVADACRDADIVIECTGVGQLVFDVMHGTAANGIVCLAGLSSGQRQLKVDWAELNKSLVLENDVVFGSVNANRRHYLAAAAALAVADRSWLNRLITRRETIENWEAAFERRPDDVKTVITFDPQVRSHPAHTRWADRLTRYRMDE